MAVVQHLARCLLAAGGASDPEGQGTYLFYEEEGDLVEKLWTGSEIGGQTFVASGVRANTSAPCLVAEDKRAVFCIDESNILRQYMYNPDDEEWLEASVLEQDIYVHPESKLAATISAEDEHTVFFQGPDGGLQGLVNRNGSWELLSPVPATPLVGTALSLLAEEESLRVYYMDQTNALHYLLYTRRTGKWKDNIVEHCQFDAPTSRFLVVQDPESGLFEGYFIVNNIVTQVEASGKRNELGKISEGNFVPMNMAQAGNRIEVWVRIETKRGRKTWQRMYSW